MNTRAYSFSARVDADRPRAPDCAARQLARNSSRNSRRSDFARPRVAREQRALDGLGQVGQREDRAVEVGEVRRERRALLWREFGHGVRYTRSAKPDTTAEAG